MKQKPASESQQEYNNVITIDIQKIKKACWDSGFKFMSLMTETNLREVILDDHFSKDNNSVTLYNRTAMTIFVPGDNKLNIWREHPIYFDNQVIMSRIDKNMFDSGLLFIGSDIYYRTLRHNQGQARVVTGVGVIDCVKLYLSVNPVPQYAVMDTGSGFLWIQCYECDISTPYYNPSASIFYDDIACDTQTCMDFPDNRCGDERKCRFSASYVSGPSVTGTVGKDLLTFVSDGLKQTIWSPLINFGCSYVGCTSQPRKMLNDSKITGVFGIGVGRASILAQMKYARFSYCIGKLNAPDNQDDKLILGDVSASFVGQWMLLFLYNTHYHVALDEIYFGSELIANRSRLEIDSGGDRVILDTASTYSHLSDAAYYPLEAMMMRELADKERPWTSDYNERCYTVTFDDLLNFPDVILKFVGSTNAVITICFAIFPSSKQARLGKRSVLGLLAQQNHNWTYSLDSKTVYFNRVLTCKSAE
ncbi:aspartyl protease UND-like [Mercurialis annua]|uniref:aspartyl protease UND-like n=1 Tax=Mercurialis annua TaxID=3986 RepID=UPI00215F8586|nr:aspartyl protease UND-like [Mercurialis annua]